MSLLSPAFPMKDHDMNRTLKTRSRHIVLTLVLIMVWAGIAMAADRNHRPSVVFILADDMGYGDLACYGSDTIRTPHIDSLAAQGLKLTDFYMAGASCTPSRAALMTGCYAQRVGLAKVLLPTAFPKDWPGPFLWPELNHGISIVDGCAIGINPKEITLGELLQAAGYRTGLIGKWHLGDLPDFMPNRNGFDSFFGLPTSNVVNPVDHPGLFPPLPLYRNEEIIEWMPEQDNLTRRYTEEAVTFIHENRERPFFLLLSHSMPHRSIHVSDRFKERFSEEQLNSIKPGKPSSRDFLYPAAIEELDWSTGEVLNALDECGIAANTLVVFTSDNGPIVGSSGPLRGRKGQTHLEGGVRVPCVMRWPERIDSGRVKKGIVTVMDFYPTLAAMAGAEVPPTPVRDGINMLSYLTDSEETDSPRQAFYYVHNEQHMGAVRRGVWKYAVGSEALYNLEEDIGESRNLADVFPARTVELKRQAVEFLSDLQQNSRPCGMIPVMTDDGTPRKMLPAAGVDSL